MIAHNSLRFFFFFGVKITNKLCESSFSSSKFYPCLWELQNKDEGNITWKKWSCKGRVCSQCGIWSRSQLGGVLRKEPVVPSCTQGAAAPSKWCREWSPNRTSRLSCEKRAQLTNPSWNRGSVGGWCHWWHQPLAGLFSQKPICSRIHCVLRSDFISIHPSAWQFPATRGIKY